MGAPEPPAPIAIVNVETSAIDTMHDEMEKMRKALEEERATTAALEEKLQKIAVIGKIEESDRKVYITKVSKD